MQNCTRHTRQPIPNTIEAQLDLEDESRGLGIKRYQRTLEESRKKTGEAETRPGIGVISTYIPIIAKQLENMVTEGLEGRAGKHQAPFNFLLGFEDDYEKAAFIALRALFQSISDKAPSLTKVAQQVGHNLGMELQYQVFEAEEKGLYITLQRHIQQYTSEKRRRNIVNHAMRKFEVIKDEFTTHELVNVGTRVISLICEFTGLFHVTKEQRGKHLVWVIVPDESLMETLNDAHSRMEMLTPLHMPMVVEPNPWDTVRGGGYLGVLKASIKLIRGASHAYEEDIRNTDMPEVYDALNHLQSTKWAINEPVLNVMETLWEQGKAVAGLPERDKLPLPAKPHDIDTNEEARNLWKAKARKVHEYNNTVTSKRIALDEKIKIAHKFALTDHFYFPWSLDWRGRAYPVTSFINPQADDSGKALLRFAEGVPLGEGGGYWLAVHIANLFGVDKVSFDDRVAWVLDNNERILDSGMSPLDGECFWMSADDPFLALAACFEWVGYSIQGDEYVSHLPINHDGSCNGLQNFSAMMRDEVGGKAVNLVPSEYPNDIYNEVKSIVVERVASDATEDNAIAQAWLGKVTRKLCKRPVMTLPYGATKFGMRQQVREEVKKLTRDNREEYLGEGVDVNEACAYLGDLIFNSIREVVKSATDVMDWLQECARILSAEDMPIHWTTPVGFVVNQRYRFSDKKQVRTLLGTQRIKLKIRVDNNKLDKRKQASGISPNFVHSMDAAHMMKTVNLCREYGLDSVSFIHDSYGTHAGNMSLMFRLLREAFVGMYEEDVLGTFKEELEGQLDEGIALPDIPTFGDIKLQDILDSDYFFA